MSNKATPLTVKDILALLTRPGIDPNALVILGDYPSSHVPGKMIAIGARYDDVLLMQGSGREAREVNHEAIILF